MEGRQPPAPEDAAAAVDPRLVAALAVQLDAWRATLRAGTVRVGWKLGVGDGERIGGELSVGHLASATVPTIGGVCVALELVDLSGPPGAAQRPWSRPTWARWGGWSCRSCPSWPAGPPAR